MSVFTIENEANMKTLCGKRFKGIRYILENFNKLQQKPFFLLLLLVISNIPPTPPPTPRPIIINIFFSSVWEKV